MSLSQDWALDLQESQRIVELAEEAQRAAYAARDAVIVALRQEGFSLRETAALVGVTFQRVSQVDARSKAEGWGEMRPQTAAERLQTAREAFQAAKHAQKLREERYAMGYRTETRAFYGAPDAPQAEETETPVRWQGFYQAAGVEL